MLKRLLGLVLFLAATGVCAHSQTYTYPALQTNNTFTGINIFNGAVQINGGCTQNGNPCFSGGGGTLDGSGTAGHLACWQAGTTLEDCLADYGVTTVGQFTFQGGIGVIGSTNGFLSLVSNGVSAPSAPANGVLVTVPNSVTPYTVVLPGTQGTGALTNDGAGHTSWTPAGGSGGFTYDAPSNTATLTANFALGGPITNVGLLGEGESTMACSTCMTTGAPLGQNASTHGPPYDAGAAGNEDLISALNRDSQFKNRTLFAFNGAQGGTTCQQMQANFTAHDYAQYAPGGSAGLPAGGTLYDLIWTGKNDALHNTSKADYVSCMNNHLDTVTALGMTPVLLTVYYSSSSTDFTNTFIRDYNTYIQQMKGRIINGIAVRVFDIAGQFPSTTMDPNFVQSVSSQQYATTYLLDSYQITRTGSAPNFTSTITLNIDPSTSPGTTSFLGTCVQVADACTSLLLGGFQTSLGLNLVNATYASGTGTNTIVATLSEPLPSTGLVTETGYFIAWYLANPAGLHMGPQGYENVATFINNTWQISGTGTSYVYGQNNDYRAPLSGTDTLYGVFCLTGAKNTAPGTGNRCPSGLLPGDLSASNIPEQGSPNAAGFYAAQGVWEAGPNSFLRFTPTQTVLQLPTYTGPVGGIGNLTVASGGTSYVIGDNGTISGGTSGTYQVTAVTVGGICVRAGTTPGPVCDVKLTVGGSAYGTTAGAATTATSGSGSGLTVNIFLASSAPFTIMSPGADLQGGSFYAKAAQIGGIPQDTKGFIGSYTLGKILTAIPQPGAFGSSYTNLDTVTLIESTDSSATATASVNTSGPLTATIIPGGTGYTTATSGLATSGCSGGETGIQVGIVAAAGAPISVAISNPGSGSATIGDTCNIVEVGASGGSFTIATVASHQIYSLALIGLGTNYATATSVPTTGGTGTGFQAGITVHAGGLVLGALGQGIFDNGNVVAWSASGPVSLNKQFIAPSFIDSGLTASTSPICPNGTGGAFTTAGCAAGGSSTGVTLRGQGAPVAGTPIAWTHSQSTPVNSTAIFSSSVTSGDVLVCTEQGESFYDPKSTPTDTVGTLYRSVAFYQNTSVIANQIWIGRAGGTGANTVTTNNSGTSVTIGCDDFPIGTALVDIIATPVINSLTPSTTVVTQTAGELLYGSFTLARTGGTPAFTAGSGFTLGLNFGGSITFSQNAVASEYLLGASQGSHAIAMSTTGSTATETTFVGVALYAQATGGCINGNWYRDDANGNSWGPCISGAIALGGALQTNGNDVQFVANPFINPGGVNATSVDGVAVTGIPSGAGQSIITDAAGKASWHPSPISGGTSTCLTLWSTPTSLGTAALCDNGTNLNASEGVTVNLPSSASGTGITLNYTGSNSDNGFRATTNTPFLFLTDNESGSGDNTGGIFFLADRNFQGSFGINRYILEAATLGNGFNDRLINWYATSSTTPIMGLYPGGVVGWRGTTSGGNPLVDTGLSRDSAGVVDVGNGAGQDASGTIKAANAQISAITQQAASNTGGTCAMSAGTSCTITIAHTYTTPVCIATQQSSTLTGGAVGCTVSGTTVTITSAVLNSETWGALVFGNPN